MKGKLEHVKVAKITDEDFQTRLVAEDGAFHELVRSVQRDGILVPILLLSAGDRFTVVAGHRRYAAARRVGLEEVPCYIVDGLSGNGWSGAFAENMFRRDLTPIEQAAAIVDCLEGGEFSEESLASALGRSEQWVRHQVVLASWPAELQEVVHQGKLSVSAAQNLAAITDTLHRKMLIDYACDNGATARTTAAWLQAWHAGRVDQAPGEIEVEPSSPGLPPIEPYTLCAICRSHLKMIELSYLPVCGGCSEIVMELARSLAEKGEGTVAR